MTDIKQIPQTSDIANIAILKSQCRLLRSTMRSSLVCRNIVCLLLILQPLLDGAVAAFGGQSVEAVANQVTEFRIRSQNLHIDDVERHLSELEHQFESPEVPRIDEALNRVEARVRTIESKSLFECVGSTTLRFTLLIDC